MKINKNIFRLYATALSVFILAAYFSGCGNSDEMGIGPIKNEIKLASNIDNNLVEKGKNTFSMKCSSCHKFDSRLVGPPLKDVTKRRRPEWIMNQILNPVQMVQENKISKELFAQYLIQMTFQDVTQDDARNILEYFRAVDANQTSSN
jgi:mono/diheme cytochrome c family protein